MMATQGKFDESITAWLEETAPSRLPERVLESTFERTRRSGQQVRWGGLLRGMHLTRSTLVLGGSAAVALAAVLVLGPRVAPPSVGELPTTPDAWSRVSIDSRWATGQVDALVAGPRGLLAILGETGSSDMQLSVSTDGRSWALVPNDRFPSPDVLLPPPGSLRLPAVGTAHGFLFVADGNDVWASEDGYAWQRLDDRTRDLDLQAGTVLAVAVGGPGLVAVGSDNRAWYSEDGSDWTLAEVPAPPTDTFEAQGFPPPTVAMQGVVASGETLLAWGIARSRNASDGMQETVLWTSGDGKTWANVPDAEGIEPLRTVVAGPGGFVATDMNDFDDARAIRFSADGRSWETVDALESRLPSYDEGLVASVAAASSGYVAVGGDGKCAVEPCPAAVATIWTSPDGRSWSRLPGGGLFEVADPEGSANHSGAWATSAVAWDSGFIVAGAYDASPVVWISGTPGETEAPIVTATPTESLGASEPPSPSTSPDVVAPPSEAEVTELMSAFLAARVAGEGAEQYLNDQEDVPLLYATTSGAPYERGEYEQVTGIEWPYELTAFKVRLFAGDTVVEQLLFMSYEDGRLGLGYVPDGFGTEIPPTTEDGRPLGRPYSAFDGEVTLSVAHPWVYRNEASSIKLIPEGTGPTTDGGERNGWDRLVLMADPVRYGTGCPYGPGPADAETLAESLRSDPDLETTAPVAMSAGGADGWWMDVRIAAGANGDCGGLRGDTGLAGLQNVALGAGDRMRLYLFDAPEESPMRILAIAFVVPESDFERAAADGGPIVSVEFLGP